MNEYKDLADALNKGKDGIPRARRFRDNLQNIEKELSTGVRIPYLVKCLDTHGFKITAKAFKEELYRARKLAREQPENKPVTENKVNTVTTKKQITENTENGGNSQNTEVAEVIKKPFEFSMKKVKAETSKDVEAVQLNELDEHTLKLIEKAKAKEAKK